MVRQESIPKNLLEISPAGGCACKVPLDRLQMLLSGLDATLQTYHPSHHKVLIDSSTRDDAALYNISADTLLAVSVDFGTPVSTDPEVWGAIAALNALSDIFAVGAIPFLALSMVGWPSRMSDATIGLIMKGAVRALADSATQLVGGHTITSDIPLFGLCVIGKARQQDLMLIRNAKPRDRLILTKAIGTGIVTAAQKANLVSAEVIKQSEQVMLASNQLASSIAVELGVAAATDVSGYGLIGHLANMMAASKCSARISLSRIPALPNVTELLTEHGMVPNSAERNYFTLEEQVDWGDTPYAERFLLADPQTSGGLLLSARPSVAEEYLKRCDDNKLLACDIGIVSNDSPKTITILA